MGTFKAAAKWMELYFNTGEHVRSISVIPSYRGISS
jgi:hypothetical protein